MIGDIGELLARRRMNFQRMIPTDGIDKELREKRMDLANVKKLIADLRAIDVPNDGNCLFYALGVGLRKKYVNHRTYRENFIGM